MADLCVPACIDACPRESVSAWSSQLRALHPTFLFRSASRFLPAAHQALASGKAKEPADDALGSTAITTHLGNLAAEKPEGAPLVVAVIGVTNVRSRPFCCYKVSGLTQSRQVGKSAFVNSIAQKSASAVYTLPSLAAPSRTPTTTTYALEVSVPFGERTVRFVDTPGLSYVSSPNASAEEAEATRAADILLRSKGRIDRLKDPLAPGSCTPLHSLTTCQNAHTGRI
jgi:nuclear GTP-binding protein